MRRRRVGVGELGEGFDRGSDPFFDYCSLGWDYTRAGGGSIFATGCNVDYRRELLAGDPLLRALRIPTECRVSRRPVSTG